MSDSRTNTTKSLQVPQNLEDTQVVQQFLQDLLEVLDTVEKRVQKLEELHGI